MTGSTLRGLFAVSTCVLFCTGLLYLANTALNAAHERQCAQASELRADWLDCPTETSTVTNHDGEDVAATVEQTPTVTRTPMLRVRPSAASRSRLSDPAVVSGSHLSSTAYCETSLMANGQHTRRGVAAGNRWKLGTVLHVSDSPYGPGDFVVLDRIGHGSDLDFAMPGDCDGARQWGRRTITAEVVR